MSRSLDRAFNQAQQKHRKNTRRRKRIDTEEQDNTTAQQEDPASTIIIAFNEKDYLKVLRLPAPDVDALGNPVWSCDKDQISKSYRQMTLLVHPDKNSGDLARQAFQLLNKAYKILLNDDQRRSVLKLACEAAKKEKEKQEGKATVDEIIKINSEKIQEKRKLAKAQHEDFNSEILRQMKDRKVQGKLKKQRLSSTQYKNKSTNETLSINTVISGNDGQDANSKKESEEVEWSAAVLRKTKHERRKPKFLF
eukprot:g3962.t1